MIKAPLALLFILLFSCTAQSSSLNFLTNAFASKNGEVPILKDSNGLYVEADLSSKPSSKDTVKMMISLPNRETLLTTNCFDFDKYSCSTRNCTPHTYTVTVDYPYFTAVGQYAETPTILDSSNWILNTYAYLGSECRANNKANVGKGRGGVIGLANYEKAKKNFIGSKIFSVFLNSDKSGGKLLWKFDPSLANSSEIISLPANDKWDVSLYTWSMTIGSFPFGISGTLMFDIHTEGIGLPLSIFNAFMSNLEMVLKVNCTRDKYKPTCFYKGYISDLPKFSLDFKDKSIPLPLEVVLEDPTTPFQETIQLRFKVLGSNLDGENFLTGNFKDRVVLDAAFMRYYYTVFDRTNQTISLYVKGKDPVSPGHSSSSGTFYVECGVGALLFSIAATVYFVQKKLKASSASMAGSAYAPVPAS